MSARLGLLSVLAATLAGTAYHDDLPLYGQHHASPRRRRRGGAARRRRWAAHYWRALHWSAFGRTPSPMEWQRREREARRRQRGQR